MVDVQALGMIWKREILRVVRDPSQIGGSVARPILWLVVMGLGMGPAFAGFSGMRYVEYLLPGIVAMNLIFSAFLSAISIIWDREFGFLKEMLVAPITRTSIAVGKSASGATVSCLQGCIVLAFLPILGISLQPWRILAGVPIMFLIAFPLTAVGLWIASKMTSFEGFGTIANFVIMPMFFLSGAVFPIQQAPPALQFLSRVNPLAYGVDLLRGVFYGVWTHPAWLDLLVLVVFSTVALAGAVRAFRYRL